MLKAFERFIISLLSTDGSISSKRSFGLVGLMSLIFLMIYNVLKCTEGLITSTLIDSVTYITIAALFGTSIEKIWPKKSM